MASETLTLELTSGTKISARWITGECSICKDADRCLRLAGTLVTNPICICSNCLIFVDAARQLDPGDLAGNTG